MEYEHHSISLIPVIIFGFITISFTSYNLDMYDKQKIGLIGNFLVVLFYIAFGGLRVQKIIQAYKKRKEVKEKKGKKGKEEEKRDVTDQNLGKEPYRSEGEQDEPMDGLREDLRY
mmetsp:Transcript_20347/g.20042  ORF Transcript_20347/g.20042 Transcript_20347/m.20042 type:complete len:115 (+) Transcript_20347:1560-1904(+)